MMVRVLFVCLGNICRSPTAEGVFRLTVARAGLADAIAIDSAGTHAYHVGEPPDTRAQEAAARRGIDLSPLRGRRVSAEDLTDFDYVLAMDRENYRNLLAICPHEYQDRVAMLMDFASDRPEEEVPDPYYGGSGGFDRVLDMIEDAAEGLLNHIRRQHAL
jgi:protein-tyrosine phosphatase